MYVADSTRLFQRTVVSICAEKNIKMATLMKTGFIILLSILMISLRSTSIEARISSPSSPGNKITRPSVTFDHKPPQEFAKNLFIHAHAIQGGNENLCISPIAVWKSLSLILEGAEGATRDQLKSVLCYNKINGANDEEIIRKRFRTIKTALNITTSDVTVDCVDTFIVNNFKNEILPEYQSLIRKEYGAQLLPLNFNNPNTRSTINELVKTTTRGKITEIVPPGDLSDKNLIIVSAAFFQGGWKIPFDKNDTSEEAFFNDDGEVIGSVNMMLKETSSFRYTDIKSLRADVVEIPYGDGKKISMLLFVPMKNVPLSTVMSNLQNVSLNEIMTALDESYPGDLEISIPSFNITTKLDMRETLQHMGLQAPFDRETADLSKMFGNSGSYISQVIHKSQIEVNENGTIASGAVYLEAMNRSIPPSVRANKPFFYLIIEKTTNIIIFAGSYVKPEKV